MITIDAPQCSYVLLGAVISVVVVLYPRPLSVSAIHTIRE